MRKRDSFVAILLGVIIGVLWTAIFLRLGTLNFLHLGLAIWGLVIIVPIGAVLGVYIGDRLSHWKSVFLSLARFAIVGFLNTGVDIGTFNLLIYFTQIEKGPELSLFKSAGFVAAVMTSYFANKYWTFQSGSTGDDGREFVKFGVVTALGLGINVGVTYLVANHVLPVGGLSQLSWDNVAAVIATVCSLIWNFLGYKLVVFKRK